MFIVHFLEIPFSDSEIMSSHKKPKTDENPQSNEPVDFDQNDEDDNLCEPEDTQPKSVNLENHNPQNEENGENNIYFELQKPFGMLQETNNRYEAANFGRSEEQKREMNQAREENNADLVKKLEKRFQNNKVNCQIMFDMVVQAPRSKTTTSDYKSDTRSDKRKRAKPWHKFVDSHLMCVLSNKIRETILVNRRRIFGTEKNREAVIPVGHHYSVIEIDSKLQPALNLVIVRS